MGAVEMNSVEFEKRVEDKGTLVVDFWAPWCGPCRAFAPVFEAASVKHPDVTWAKVNTDANQDLAGALGIQAIPTLMVFRDGILLFRQPGVIPAAGLEQLVSQVQALDMDEIRREVAAQTATEGNDPPA